jgi:hypothetical protein
MKLKDPIAFAKALIIAGLAPLIFGYARLSTPEYCSQGVTSCITTEFYLDLAALYVGLFLVAGGFASIAIISLYSRRNGKQGPGF